jgi:hypothetical protein
MEKLNHFKCTTLQAKNISDIDIARILRGSSNRVQPFHSDNPTESNSDSEEELTESNIDAFIDRRRTISVPKGKNVSRDTSGCTDLSSSTASTSDSDCDDSFDLNDPTVRKVSFSNVSIRTYSLAFGETQATKSYPISLDWAHTPTKTVDISVFETQYASARKASTTDSTQCKMVRGFRIPRRIRTAERLELLSSVTGQKPEELYESNLARITREDEYIPETACCSDDGFVDLRPTPYQLVDSDDYEKVVI